MRKLLRFPAISQLNTRMSATNPIPASSGIVGIGVVGIMVVGQTVEPTAKDSRFVNCFKQTVGEKVYCVKRSGLDVYQTPQSGSVGNQIMVWSGLNNGDSLITAFGATSSSIYNATTLIATNNTVTTNISSLATSITETTVNNNPVLYITGSNSKGWFYDPSVSTSIMQITSAQYPGNNSLSLAGGGAHMDGYTFQMDTRGGIWNSALNTISTWTATGVINANIQPDRGIGCIRWKQYIVGFGPESMEFFYNAGNAQGSPLSRVANMAQRIGAVSADAITQIADNIFFCGSTAQGGLSVYMFDGNISRISPPEIDAVLLLAGASNIKLTAMRDLGLSFILVKASTTQYAYVVEEKFWFIWSSSLGFVRFAGLSVGSNQVVYGVSENYTSGKTYAIDNSARVFTDDSLPFSAHVQPQTLDPGNGEFVAYEEFQIKADVETGNSEIMVQYSDDDYQNFSNPRSLNLSTNIPKLTRLGGTKNPRAFALSHSDPTAMRIEELRVRVNIR